MRCIIHSFGFWEPPRTTKVRKTVSGFGDTVLTDCVIQTRQCTRCGLIERRDLGEGRAEDMGWAIGYQEKADEDLNMVIKKYYGE